MALSRQIRFIQSSNRTIDLSAATATATTATTIPRKQRHTVSYRHRWIVVAMTIWTIALAERSVRSYAFRTAKSCRMTVSRPGAGCWQGMSAVASSFSGLSKLRIATEPPMHSSRGKKRSYGSSTITMMPEGPEVRTLVDQLQGGIGKRLVDVRFLSGRYMGQRPVGFADFARTMTPITTTSSSNGNDDDQATTSTTVDTILDWNCKGKFIYMLLDDGARALDETKKDNDDFQRSIWITLGMTGRFYNEAKHLEDPSYGRWVLELQSSNSNENENENDNESNRHMIYYHDKRNFGTVKFCLSKSELEAKLKSLGPDVLALARQTANVRDLDDPSITIDDELAAQNADRIATTDFLQLLEKQRNPNINVCKLLMDQKKVAGVGNYILSEVLYRSDIDPFCGIDELSTSQRIKLFREIQAVCLESYLSQQESSKQGVGDGYTSVRNLEPFDFELCVYGNLGNCPKGTPVIRETNGPHGRTIWYTEDQLFVARHIREERECKLREDLRSQKQAPQAPPKAPARDPWTITRRDGEDVFGDSNNDSNAGDDSSDAIDEEEGSESTWNILDGLTEPGWKAALEPYVATSQSFASLQDFLEDEYSYYGREMIYPPPHQIFAALNLCPLDTVKVVILGQDPYHGPNQSTGLAFSVSKQISRIPPSLKNIFKELDDDVGRNMEKEPPLIRHGDLEGWAKQGVLMINTVLTVRRGQANSHQRKGWEDFTDQVVKILVSSETTEGGVVFLLWGGPASKKASSILTSPSGGGDSNNKHVVISTSHPSPLGATKTASPFLTSRCFSRANAALAELGQDPIDWYER